MKQTQQTDVSGTKSVVNMNNCLLHGENVRLRLHDAHLISDRLWQNQKFSRTFVCSQGVDFLTSNFEIPSRDLAVKAFQMFQSHSIVRSLQNAEFTDDDSLARFCRDEDFFRLENDLKLVLKAKAIEDRLFTRSNGILTVFHDEEDGEPYFAFSGTNILEWLLDEKFSNSRLEAMNMCKRFVENSIIKHVEDRYNFQDDPKIFYRIHSDFVTDISLLDLTTIYVETTKKQSHARRLSETDCNLNHRLPVSLVTTGTTTLATTIERPESPSQIIAMFHECNELFVKKTFKIESDGLGYGFVIRGSAPSYIHTIDPEGPAKRAGIKVGHIIQSVDGVDVLQFHHKDTARVILSRKLGLLKLIVLEPSRL